MQDAELELLIRETLGEGLGGEIPGDVVRQLSTRVQSYMGSENKRKNLLGESFEDTLAELIRRYPRVGEQYDVVVRPRLHELRGFNAGRVPGSGVTRRVVLCE